MALANIACILSQRESRDKVLTIDWDLEAPGLHRYFQSRIPISKSFISFEKQLGLIDLFYEANRYCEYKKLDDDNIPETFFDDIGFEKYILRTNIDSLYLMTAGMLDNTYASRVANFDWNALFEKYPSIISKFAEYLAQKFNHILINSRTGHTDISGICTTLMPDKLVVVFTPNMQSLSGVLDISSGAIEYRKQSDDLRQLVVFPLVSRVEPAEPKLREEWRFGNSGKNIPGYQTQFQDLFTEIYGLSHCDMTSYFDDVQIQHVPRYAYGEDIAALSERSEDRLSLARSYENFVERLINQERPWDSLGTEKEPIDITNKIKDSEYEIPSPPKRRGARIEKTVFIAYRRKDISWALTVYQYLTSNGYDVFFDYTSIPSGDFERIIIANIKARAHFVLILTPTALDQCNMPGDWLRQEIETAMDEKRNFIPLFFDGFSFGSPNVVEKLTGKLADVRRYNGLEVPAGYFMEAMEKLRSHFLNVPLDAQIHPLSPEVRNFIKQEQDAVDNAIKAIRPPKKKSWWSRNK